MERASVRRPSRTGVTAAEFRRRRIRPPGGAEAATDGLEAPRLVLGYQVIACIICAHRSIGSDDSNREPFAYQESRAVVVNVRAGAAEARDVAHRSKADGNQHVVRIAVGDYLRWRALEAAGAESEAAARRRSGQHPGGAVGGGANLSI